MTDKLTGIAGFGKTGRALINFILRSNPKQRIVVFTDKPVGNDSDADSFRARGVEFVSGPAGFSALEKTAQIILSPGVDGSSPRFQKLRTQGIDLLSELEYAYGFSRAPVIGVSGTNGKSTTVSLIHHLIEKAGRHVLLAGNIGTPFVELVDKTRDDGVAVLEISSFQLEEIRRFRPHVGVLLNITPDHLDRYPDIDAYAQAKFNLFKNQTDQDYWVANYDDPLIRKNLAENTRGTGIWFSVTRKVPGGVFLEDGRIVFDFLKEKEFLSVKDFPLPGSHNLANLMAAAAAARIVGVAAAVIEKNLKDFTGLAHRMQTVAEIGNVRFINDSKATNVDAAEKAASSINRDMVLVLGGKDKGGDFSRLLPFICSHGRGVLLLGQAADRIRSQLSSVAHMVEEVDSLAEAVDRGYALLRESGGTVLLAPGCASFDMFRSFEHRGDVFARAVENLKNRIEKITRRN